MEYILDLPKIIVISAIATVICLLVINHTLCKILEEIKKSNKSI